MQSGAQCTMSTSTTPKNIRLTITVTPEVHATFSKFAKVSNMSISRAMGEWLGDTSEAAQFMADKMQQARSAPALVIREMHAYALGMVDETSGMLENVRAKAKATAAEGSKGTVRGRLRPKPPSSNTGGKGPSDRPHKKAPKP